MNLPRRAAAVILSALAIFLLAGCSQKTSYFTSKADRGEIRDVVEATGTINAVITVQVGSQVSGTISELHADFNSRVKKDQVIARLDPSLFQGALLQARADLENARANAAAARANFEKAKATNAQAQATFQRTKSLAAEGVMSQQQLDVDQAAAESAAAEVSASKAQTAQADAQVSQRAAAVTVAQTNLDHTIIRAPIDGVVVSRNVDIGQTVAASLQAPVLFTIAQDLTKMQVYAKTDESDVGQIKAGQRITFKVDAFPHDVFNGAVSQVRMNSTIVQNVVTYDTIIDFDNPGQKLFPGMTAYVSIPVAVVEDVLRVPNGALRYKPDMKPEEIRALYAKYGISTGGARAGNGSQSSDSGSQLWAKTRTDPAAPGSGQGQRRPRSDASGAAAGDPPAAGGPDPQTAVVWKLRSDNTLEPVKLKLGITDHTVTEVNVIAGTLQPGDALVTGASGKSASGPTAGPGLGGGRPPGR